MSGRKADTIVSGGENVAPAEVEAVLEAHPLVLEAAVIGRSDPQWGEAVTAIVVPRAGSAVDADALRAHCAARARAVQGAQALRACLRAAAAHALGQAAAQGAAMSFDADAHRRSSLEGWEAAASGWVRQQELLRELAAPVAHWMIDAIAPQPGQRVLELAAGLGETGMLAAELVAPMGGVIISDQAEAMLDGARARAAALGLSNVEFQVLDAEWIDLPVASVDAVLCRWGYMLMADPAAAMVETRRVLRSGGRLALAVWDALERNPWALLPAQELIERGLSQPAGRGSEQPPGPFALGSAAQVLELLEHAGLTEPHVEALDLVRRHASFEELWDTHARPLAQLPRRRALAPGWRDRRDPGIAGAALHPLHRQRRHARDSRANAAGVRKRLTGRRTPIRDRCAAILDRARPARPFG